MKGGKKEEIFLRSNMSTHCGLAFLYKCSMWYSRGSQSREMFAAYMVLWCKYWLHLCLAALAILAVIDTSLYILYIKIIITGPILPLYV